MEFEPEEWEANRATFMAEYPEGTWVQLEGGTLDVGVVRATTRRERWLRPVFWCLQALQMHRTRERVGRWANPAAYEAVDELLESFKAYMQRPVS